MIAAMVAALVAGWAAVNPGRPLRRLTRAVRGPRRTGLLPAWPAALVAGVLIAGVAFGLRGGVLGAVGAMLVGTAWVLRSRHVARRRHAAAAGQVSDGCALLAREVRAGRAAAPALEVVAEDFPVFAPVAAAVRVGGSVPASLRFAATGAGHGGLTEVARAWEVTARTGAQLSPALDAVTAGLHAERDVSRTVAAELAAPRATGQVLGVLPIVGIVLGYLLGGNPIGFLIDSTYGLVCLLGGVALTCAGLLWSDHLSEPR